MFFSRPRPANLLNGLLASRIDATGPSGCFSRRSFPAGAAALGPSTSCLRMWASGVCSNGRAVYRKKCAFPWFWSTTLSPHGRPCLHLAPQRPILPSSPATLHPRHIRAPHRFRHTRPPRPPIPPHRASTVPPPRPGRPRCLTSPAPLSSTSPLYDPPPSLSREEHDTPV